MNELQYYENGIYYVQPSLLKNKEYPRLITTNNIVLVKLLGFIYIPSETEDLQAEQIESINKLRYKYKGDDYIYQFNKAIKLFFCYVINLVKPSKLLDYGCGFDPIVNHCHYSGNFHALDFDKNVIDILYNEFNIKSVEDTSSFSDEFFDLIISIFVFHFNISEKNIKEFHRILTNNGLLIANIYRSDKPYISRLKMSFIENSFNIKEISIPQKDDHKIWVIYKDYINNEMLINISKYLENF